MMSDEQVYASMSHRSERRSGHRRSSGRRLAVYLALVLALETVVLMFLIVNSSIQAKENGELVAENKKQAQALAQAMPEVEQLRAEVSELVAARLPHLIRLEFDKVIPVDKGYVKNITFTLAGTNRDQRHEYKMVMHNNGLLAVHPRVDILFFNRVGVQIGIAPLGVHKDGTLTLDMLERGEIKSFSGVVDLADEDHPEYFMVRLKP